MKEIKNSYFSIDGNQNHWWFLIDTDETLKKRNMHNVCISNDVNGEVSYIGSCNEVNLKYIANRDDRLPKPSISFYLNASFILKKNRVIYNKKKGTIINVNPLND